jgi:predicted O-linked N-acetylglucosamine transferase (SPINDLY family)
MDLLKPVQLVGAPPKKRVGPDFLGGLVILPALNCDQLIALGQRNYFEFEAALGAWDNQFKEDKRSAFFKLEATEAVELPGEETRMRILQAVFVLHNYGAHKDIVELMRRTHWLVHVHPLNTAFYNAEGDPQNVELTFVRKADFPKTKNYAAPIPDPLLDMPADHEATADLCMSSPLTIGHTGLPPEDELKSEERLKELYREGVRREEAGDFLEALKCYGRLTEIDPSFVAALNNIGCVCMQLALYEHAAVYFKAASGLAMGLEKVVPNLALAYSKISLHNLQHFRYERAMEAAHQSLIYEPYKFETPWVCYFQAKSITGSAMETLPVAQGVLFGHPDWKDLATLVLHMIFETSMSHLVANFAATWISKLDLEHDKKLAHLYCEYLKSQGKKKEAFEFAQTFGESVVASLTVAGNLFERGESYEAWKLCAKLAERDSNTATTIIVVENACINAAHCAEFDSQDLLETHLLFDKLVTPRLPPPLLLPPRSGGGPIKIGYVSSDFREHAVMRFTWALLTKHDRSKFDVHLFNAGTLKDATTDALKAQGMLTWHEIASKSTADFLKLIKETGIDILVDLASHTGGNRLDVFAVRAAPVQVTMIGYAVTTGLKNMDYKIVDHVTDPLGESEEFYTEKLVRVPHGSCFLCYTPPWFMPEPLQAKRPGHYFVFGSFAKSCKITAPVAALWSKVLKACPNSILVLKSATATSKEMIADTKKKFVLDDAEKRIHFLTVKSSVADHLKDYNYIDCCLDTFPYCGTTTTCESLCMGVPVVTLSGTAHRQNVTTSILLASGMQESLITNDPEEYLQQAETQYSLGCRDTAARRALAERFKTSRFMDAAEYTRGVEAIFEKMVL